MKKLLLLLVLVFTLGFAVSAQKVLNKKTNKIKDLKDFPIHFCTVEFKIKLTSTVGMVDVGDLDNSYILLDNETEKPFNTDNLVRVLNYMYSNGWKLQNKLLLDSGLDNGKGEYFLFVKKE